MRERGLWREVERAKRGLALQRAEFAVTEALLEQLVDLSLLKSGTTYQVTDLVQLARWGHFGDTDYPWANAVGI